MFFLSQKHIIGKYQVSQHLINICGFIGKYYKKQNCSNKNYKRNRRHKSKYTDEELIIAIKIT